MTGLARTKNVDQNPGARAIVTTPEQLRQVNSRRFEMQLLISCYPSERGSKTDACPSQSYTRAVRGRREPRHPDLKPWPMHWQDSLL